MRQRNDSMLPFSFRSWKTKRQWNPVVSRHGNDWAGAESARWIHPMIGQLDGGEAKHVSRVGDGVRTIESDATLEWNVLRRIGHLGTWGAVLSNASRHTFESI